MALIDFNFFNSWGLGDINTAGQSRCAQSRCAQNLFLHYFFTMI